MRKVLNGLAHFEETLMAMAVLIVVLINFASIVTREIDLGIKMGQSQEIMLEMFVWITFIGIPLAARKKAHLGLSMFTDMLPRQLQFLVAHLVLLIGVGFMSLVGWYGAKMVIQEYVSKQLTPAYALPVWWFGMAVPVSAALTIIRLLEVAYNDLWSPSRKEAA